ncbi:MAG: ribosome assembly cofactor RimP [Bacteroidales bacterium]|nr:ribosome assembly cofactor RimP [Bacteroidales bacterium]
MGNITINNIKQLVEEKIADTDLFIGEIKVKPGNIIYIFLDGDNGVTIDSCVEVSRYVEKHLDRNKEDFELHVSSFGLGQPLKFLRQYVNAVGKQMSVQLQDGTKLSGLLLSANEKEIVLQIAGAKMKDPKIDKMIPMYDIKTAKLEIVFK